MDYGKYKYEAAQQAKESRRKSTNVSIKEMKYRPKIGKRRLRHQDPQGREVPRRGPQGQGHDHVPGPGGRPPRARASGSSTRWPSTSATSAKVEVAPKLDGRNMTMVLAPDKRAQAAWRTPPGRRAAPPRHARRQRRPPGTARDPHADGRRPSRRGERPHAEDEDPPRRRQALQGHRHRQDPAPPGVPQPHAREEALAPATRRLKARGRSWPPATSAPHASACSAS